MKKPAFLILAVFLTGCLAVGDAFARGFRGGGHRGGSFHGGASFRSPSMHYQLGRRHSVSQQRQRAPSQRDFGRTAPARRQAAQRPGSRRPESARPGRGFRQTPGRIAPGDYRRPSQGQLKQFLDLPKQQGKAGRSDLAKLGSGIAVGALGTEGARQLLGKERPGRERPGRDIDRQPGDRGEKIRDQRQDRTAGRQDRRGDREQKSRQVAQNVRDNYKNRHDDIFGPKWWAQHPNAARARWRGNHPWHYWWRPAAWGALTGFIAGSAWSQPVSYDYGDNVYYEGDTVYMEGQPTASAQEYYQQAANIADSAPPPSQDTSGDWLPLGVFALSQGDSPDSNMVLQLAVNKKGVMAGTYYNLTTKTTRPIKGMVDKKTQRAAWTFADGKNTDFVMETGIYNLTKDQTEALIHFGKDKTQKWLMVRLDEPEAEKKTAEKAR
jgi:hypothetical protein